MLQDIRFVNFIGCDCGLGLRDVVVDLVGIAQGQPRVGIVCRQRNRVLAYLLQPLVLLLQLALFLQQLLVTQLEVVLALGVVVLGVGRFTARILIVLDVSIVVVDVIDVVDILLLLFGNSCEEVRRGWTRQWTAAAR